MGFVGTGLLYFPSYLFPAPVAFIKVTSHMKILFNSDCIVFLVQRQTDRHLPQGLTQSRETSIMSITSGKTPHCSRPHTMRKTQKERGDETEWKKQWEGMKGRQGEDREREPLCIMCNYLSY